MAIKLALVTAGDISRLTGGYLYHRRLAEHLPHSGAQLEFAVLPDRVWPLVRSVSRAWREARRAEPNVILVDSIVAAFLAISPPPTNVPIVAVVHQVAGGMGAGIWQRQLQRRLDLSLYRRATGVIACSPLVMADLATGGVDPSRIRVVVPGLDVPAIGLPSRRSRRSDEPVELLCVANWLQHKRIDVLVDAFALLPRRAAKLHLVGETTVDDRYRRRVLERIGAGECGDDVIVHGPLARDELTARYASADAFVTAAVGEAYGTVFAEALAAGLPVVAVRSGFTPSLVEEGETGMLVPPDDRRALAEALSGVVNDSHVRLRLGAEAALRAKVKFADWEATSKAFLSAVLELVESA